MSAARLHLPALAMQRIREAAGTAWPHEACGLLEGQVAEDGVHVSQTLICANVHAEPRHRYTIDPEDFLHAEHAARDRGRSIVGTWHSHPNGAPVPSETDRNEAWPGWSYLIAGVTNGAVTALRCWCLDDGTFHEQPIVTVAAPAPDQEVPDERT